MTKQFKLYARILLIIVALFVILGFAKGVESYQFEQHRITINKSAN